MMLKRNRIPNSQGASMAARGTYNTHQRELVSTCLTAHADRYLTVDEVWLAVSHVGGHVGRTTVYRNLEALASAGKVLKATAPGGEASYRLRPKGATGQLVCVECRRAFPLDCHMATEFSDHVLEHHGFKVLPTRTVLYGLCQDCAHVVDAPASTASTEDVPNMHDQHELV